MRKTKLILTLTVIIMCVALLFTMLSVSAANKYGDVDLDGDIAIIDATLIQRHLAKLSTLTDEQLSVAKVSTNEQLSILDATYIQRLLAKLIDKFPVEESIEPSATETETNPTQVITPTEDDTMTKVDTTVKIYFSNNKNWSKVNAYLYNSQTSQANATWPGVEMTDKVTNSFGETVYSMSVDTTVYDRIIFNNGTAQTTDTPVTVANSGYFLLQQSYGKWAVGLYPYGQEKEGTIKYVDLEYSKGYNKQITIWTPVGYDANDTSKKYSVLYMTDGQNIFGDKQTLSGCEWEVDETVLSYMQNGGDGIIVVGVDNSNSKRDSELTPDIGDVVPSYNSGGFKNGTGEAYSDFVVEKVIPYIEANYNVNGIRGIAGSSSGGIESFYIGMEHMDKFDYIGALSPAFLLYDESTWKTYLSKFDFTDTNNLPRIYFFNGNSSNDALEQELYKNAVAMQGWMESLGYPSELMTTVVDNDATHSELYWAIYFPETLSFCLGY